MPKLFDRAPQINTAELLTKARRLGIVVCHERFSWSDGLLVNRWYLDFAGVRAEAPIADREGQQSYSTESDAYAALRRYVENYETRKEEANA